MAESIGKKFTDKICLLGKRYPSLVFIRVGGRSFQTADDAEIRDIFRDRMICLPAGVTDWMSFAAGIASAGKMVVAETEQMDVVDEMRFAAARVKKNITLCLVPPETCDAAVASSEDLAIARTLPSAEVFASADAEETDQVLDYCVTRHVLSVVRLAGPLTRDAAPPVFNGNCRFSPGEWPRLREGTDVGILACGSETPRAIQASAILASQGVSASVWNASSIKPADPKTILFAAKKCRGLVSCEPQISCAGLGGVVSEILTEHGLATKMIRVGISRGPADASGVPDEILRAVRTLLKVVVTLKKR